MARACFLLVLVTVAAKPVAGMSVEYVQQTKYVFSDIEKQTIQAVADSSEQEVRQVLPQLRADLTLEVTEGPWVTAETGASGSAVAPRRVRVMIDATRDGGVIGTVRRELRSLLFHELHHLVRVWTDTGRSPLSHVSSTRLLDRVLSEGMATVSNETSPARVRRGRHTRRRSASGPPRCCRSAQAPRTTSGCFGTQMGERGLVIAWVCISWIWRWPRPVAMPPTSRWCRRTS
jgi:uncharacterized protein YjaZ